MIVPLVWRSDYVAAVLDPAVARRLGRLTDLGFEVIVFPPALDEGGLDSAWAEPFRRLALALGRSA
jgi:hypothetical protein